MQPLTRGKKKIVKKRGNACLHHTIHHEPEQAFSFSCNITSECQKTTNYPDTTSKARGVRVLFGFLPKPNTTFQTSKNKTKSNDKYDKFSFVNQSYHSRPRQFSSVGLTTCRR